MVTEICIMRGKDLETNVIPLRFTNSDACVAGEPLQA